jgi:hypothetical protein
MRFLHNGRLLLFVHAAGLKGQALKSTSTHVEHKQQQQQQ